MRVWSPPRLVGVCGRGHVRHGYPSTTLPQGLLMQEISSQAWLPAGEVQAVEGLAGQGAGTECSPEQRSEAIQRLAQDAVQTLHAISHQQANVNDYQAVERAAACLHSLDELTSTATAAGEGLSTQAREACELLLQLVAASVEHLMRPRGPDAIMPMPMAQQPEVGVAPSFQPAPTALLATFRAARRLGLAQQGLVQAVLSSVTAHTAEGVVGAAPALAHILAMVPPAELAAPQLLQRLQGLVTRSGTQPGAPADEPQAADEAKEGRGRLSLLPLAKAVLEQLADMQYCVSSPVRQQSGAPSLQKSASLIFRDMFSTDLTDTTEVLILEPLPPPPATSQPTPWQAACLEFAGCQLLGCLLPRQSDGGAQCKHVCELVRLLGSVPPPGASEALPLAHLRGSAERLAAAVHTYSASEGCSSADRGALIYTCLIEPEPAALTPMLQSLATSIIAVQASEWLQSSSAAAGGGGSDWEALLMPWAHLVSQSGMRSNTYTTTATSAFAADSTSALHTTSAALARVQDPRRLAPLLVLSSCAPPAARAAVLNMLLQLLQHLAARIDECPVSSGSGSDCPASGVADEAAACCLAAAAAAATAVAVVGGECPWALHYVRRAAAGARISSPPSSSWPLSQGVEGEVVVAGLPPTESMWKDAPAHMMLSLMQHRRKGPGADGVWEETCQPTSSSLATAVLQRAGCQWASGLGPQASSAHPLLPLLTLCDKHLPLRMAAALHAPPASLEALQRCARLCVLSITALAAAAPPSEGVRFNACDTLQHLSAIAAAFDEQFRDVSTAALLGPLALAERTEAQQEAGSTTSGVPPAATPITAPPVQLQQWLGQLLQQLQVGAYCSVAGARGPVHEPVACDNLP